MSTRPSTAHKDYSGTPLWRKLGITEDARVLVQHGPEGFEEVLVALAPLPPGVSFLSRVGRGLDVVLTFCTRRSELEARFDPLARAIAIDGRLWVAWPKKASGVRSDLDFATVQRTGLEAGLVDNKSASITDVYRGLQFVWRREDRHA
jgi:hypothetical protein